MNGSTAKFIRKTAHEFDLNTRDLKRTYNRLNHIEKGQIKGDTLRLALPHLLTAVIESPTIKEDHNPIEAALTTQKKKYEPGLIRKFIAWFMLKLRFWNFETSYRYEHQLEPNT